MALDHEAIRKAYPDAVTIDDGTGAFKADGSKIELVQSKIDAARTAINKELTDTKYQRDRAAEYPSVVDQLDLIYHSGIDAWKAKIKETKDKYPKP
jgi:hypothetical protein